MTRIYRVGDHAFMLDFPDGMLSEKELEPYAPFQTDAYSGDDVLFTLSLVDGARASSPRGRIIAELDDDNGRIAIFASGVDGLTFRLYSVSGSECCRLDMSGDYRVAEARIGGAAGERRYALDTALMLLYAFTASKRDTLLLHASAVERDGRGYLFLGRSGTGKSTHSRLWTEHIEGSELLNDDNPIVRIVAGTVYVYGSPWSGKTCCYRDRRVPTGGIVRLRQAPFNSIMPLTGIRAYAALLPSCSCMKWDREMAEALHSTLSRVIGKIPVYRLDCLPDRESAVLCSEVLSEGDGG